MEGGEGRVEEGGREEGREEWRVEGGWKKEGEREKGKASSQWW